MFHCFAEFTSVHIELDSVTLKGVEGI